MYEELDYQKTALGELVLRRRSSPRVPDGVVYEVKLDDEMLMSSSVTQSEKALAQLAIDRWGPEPCDVLIGGLGLGYTAVEALGFAQVRRVDVIELLAPVIRWHRDRLVPAAQQLINDSRCTLIHGDFFDHVASAAPDAVHRYHVILLDIDHSPDSLLHPRHAAFYTSQGLTRLHEHLHPGGVFALWSSDAVSIELIAALEAIFEVVRPHQLLFDNPHIGQTDENCILLCQRRDAP